MLYWIPAYETNTDITMEKGGGIIILKDWAKHDRTASRVKDLFEKVLHRYEVSRRLDRDALRASSCVFLIYTLQQTTELSCHPG